jgi:hypothetical protein
MGLVTVDVKELENVELPKTELKLEATAASETGKPPSFSVEYSKSNRSKCKKCDEKIEKVENISS